jgi:1,4-dihydroxy-2-naphthoyl-CoA hydrolase
MPYDRSIFLADTDAAGVVYFATLLSIAHEAYEDSLAKSGISLQDFLEKGTIALPIVKAEIQFFQPLFCGDRIQIEMTVAAIEETQFALEYTIFRGQERQKPASKALTRHTCIERRSRQKTHLPESIRNWLQSLPKKRP